MASDQARLAVDSRAFPLITFDPRKGSTIKTRLSLQGNPAVKEDWYKNPKTNEEVSFIDFAREAEDLGFDMVLFELADGVCGELALGHDRNFRALHGGPHVVLVDPTSFLEGVEFPLL